MEVILKQDVDNLGFKDDVVSVKNGFGRNYLIPQGFAILATGSAKKDLAEDLRQRAHKEAKMVDAAQRPQKPCAMWNLRSKPRLDSAVSSLEPSPTKTWQIS